MTVIPSNINVVRSMRQALARRKAMSAPYRGRLREAEAKLEQLKDDHTAPEDDDPTLIALSEEVDYLRRRIKAIPFIDTFDLRYNNRVKQTQPSTQAVMFCLMERLRFHESGAQRSRQTVFYPAVFILNPQLRAY